MLASALCALATLVLPSQGRPAQADTVFVEVGSPQLDASFFKPHAARVRIYNGQGVQTAEWDNELSIGDSAGRKVMRWITTGRPVPGNPNRVLSRLFQTFDLVSLAPLGYVSSTNTGVYVQLKIDGKRVTGIRRMGGTAPVQEVNVELDAAGFMMGASDLVPVAAGLRTGTVIVAPLWAPNMTTSERRVFVVLADTTVMVEGKPQRARKVDERRRTDKSLVASWYLLMDDPYMVYGEVPLPDGTTQRMTEVPIPLR
jgi:hypothetical protein